MQHVWTVQGIFFRWELTVRVRPADDSPRTITERDQDSAIVRMKNVGHHFCDAANLHEYALEFESLSRR